MVARAVIASGIVARIVAVDPERLAADFIGRICDEALLGALPPDIDPCGENGEFHTFVESGPMMAALVHGAGRTDASSCGSRGHRPSTG